MECFKCGMVIGDHKICPNCGSDLRAYRRFVGISNYLYNQGLEKAKVGQLSGAMQDLKLSLQYNKTNTNARNLLGLIYYRIGEGAMAAREWMVSTGYQAQGNIAQDYLEEIGRHTPDHERINQSSKKFNQVLLYCRQGSLDMARIQLKKMLADDPDNLKAMQLLALIFFHEEKPEEAIDVLEKALEIDKDNPRSLGYLDECTRFIAQNGSKKQKKKTSRKYKNGNETIIQPEALKFQTFFGVAANIVFGIVIGGALVWFLAVPAIQKKAINDAAVNVNEATETIASKNQVIKTLQDEQSELLRQLEEEKEVTADKEKAIDSAEALLSAYMTYGEGDITSAGESLEKVDVDCLTPELKSIYEELSGYVNVRYMEQTFNSGSKDYSLGRYDSAITELSKVISIDETFGDGEALYTLAHAYRKNGDKVNALLLYKRVVELFPGTNAAYNASIYISQLEAE